MSTAAQIIGFMKIIEKLCSVKRDNFLSNGGYEADSDHIFKLTLLIMLVHPYLKSKVDYTKMLELALVHDLAEAVTGDVSLVDHANNVELKKQKEQAEIKAIKYYESILPSPLNTKIHDLFMEYEKRETIEARLVKALDTIDANLQGNAYNNGDIRYWAECGNDADWYYNYATKRKEIITNVDEDILTELDDFIIALTKENMKKCDIKGAAE